MMPLYRRLAMISIVNGFLAVAIGVSSETANGSATDAPANKPLPTASELLAQDTPAARQQLLDQLGGTDPAAQKQVAAALQNAPERMSHPFRTALSQLLRAQASDLREVAAAALLADRDPAGFQPIREYLTDPNQAAADRLAVLQLLRETTSRVAVGTLVDLARNETDAALSKAAFAILEPIAQRSFDNNVETLQTWWVATRQLSDDAWIAQQLARLTTQRRVAEQRVSNLEARLILTLRNSYRTADDNARQQLLDSYLTDELPAVQDLGLSLVQTQLTDGRQLSAETRTRVRQLVDSPRKSTRQLAIQTTAGIRDEADAPRFLAMLEQEQDADVRAALVNALGYLGNGSAVAKLVTLVAEAPEVVRLEALTGLGRLSERGKISDEQRTGLIEALRTIFGESQDPNQPRLRERTLWAMSRIAAQEFCADFTAALASDEPLEVREAALFGLRTIADSAQATVLADALDEPDAALRRQIVELLAAWASTAQIDALFRALNREQESEHEIRELAWSGIARLAANQDPATIGQWLTRLDADDPETPRRRRVLLAARAQQFRTGEHKTADRAAALQALADAHRDLNEQRAALDVLLERLTCCIPTEASDRANEFAAIVTFALKQNLYDAKLAGQLQALEPPPASDVVWLAMRSEIEERLKASQIDQAAAWIDLLRAHPPLTWPETISTDFDALLRRVTEFRAEQQVAVLRRALDTLAQDLNNAPAREQLLAAGAQALPLVRARLAEALAAPEATPEFEDALTDLLRQLNPEWPGFAADMPREERRRTLVDSMQ